MPLLDLVKLNGSSPSIHSCHIIFSLTVPFKGLYTPLSVLIFHIHSICTTIFTPHNLPTRAFDIILILLILGKPLRFCVFLFLGLPFFFHAILSLPCITVTTMRPSCSTSTSSIRKPFALTRDLIEPAAHTHLPLFYNTPLHLYLIHITQTPTTDTRRHVPVASHPQ